MPAFLFFRARLFCGGLCLACPRFCFLRILQLAFASQMTLVFLRFLRLEAPSY